MKTAFLLRGVHSGAKRISVGLVLLVAVMFPQQNAMAISISLGDASSFAVLAGSAITGSAGSIIAGDVGLSPNPGSDIKVLPSGQVIGTIYTIDATYTGGSFVMNPTLVGNAKTALGTAYDDAANILLNPTTGTIVGNQLGNLNLAPGVYDGGALALTGILILTGGANDVWIFRAASSLTTASGSSVQLSGGADPGNVFWQVTSSATLGSSSIFEGNILAFTSITLNTDAKVYGRVLARNGAVTLNGNNAITNDFTASAGVPDTGSTLLLLGSGLATLLAFRRRFFSPA